MSRLLNNKNINRRKFLENSAFGLASAAIGTMCPQIFSCSPKGKESDSGSRPNIIIIISDDTGWNDVGYHGSEIKTPVIDRLAKEGVEFDQFYVHPVCSPTRAALLTGKPPSRHGILSAIAGKSTKTLLEGTVTLAELLRRNGYETAITGKWHLGLRPEVGPRKYGFDHSYGYLHGQIDPYIHNYKFGDRSWHRNEEFIDEEGHATDLITDEAVRFIKSKRDKTKPFFVYAAYSIPHYPLDEPEKWTGIYDGIIDNKSRKLFAASMTHMDDGIGRILSALKDEQIEKDTVVIFLSDNGGQESWDSPADQYNGKFEPNDILGDNKPLRGWKGQLYEGGIRAPAVLSWHGRVKAKKVTQVIRVSDILPTMAYLAGARVTDDMKVEGINVWAAVKGDSIPKERVLYWRTARQLAVRKGDWKIVHNGKTPGEGISELFNIAEDPLETKNIAEENPAKLAELKKDLEKQFSMD